MAFWIIKDCSINEPNHTNNQKYPVCPRWYHWTGWITKHKNVLHKSRSKLYFCNPRQVKTWLGWPSSDESRFVKNSSDPARLGKFQTEISRNMRGSDQSGYIELHISSFWCLSTILMWAVTKTCLFYISREDENLEKMGSGFNTRLLLDLSRLDRGFV